jgi:hypothetical protein
LKLRPADAALDGSHRLHEERDPSSGELRLQALITSLALGVRNPAAG